jgi:hypothetical protein
MANFRFGVYISGSQTVCRGTQVCRGALDCKATDTLDYRECLTAFPTAH